MKISVLLVIVFLAFFVSACSQKSEVNQVTQKAAAEDSGAITQGKIVNVEIRNSGFKPETVEISKGDSVKWTNLDSSDHTVSGPTFPMPASTSPKTSGRLQPGESWTKRFDAEGFYGYSDIYDDNLKGKVVVK